MTPLLLAAAFAAEPGLMTVPALDLGRYAGTWYEIARLENRFERGCDDVTATYAVRDDGRIDVQNRCVRDGRERVATGIARVPDPSEPGKLEVSFFRPFWGDYQVILLDADYRFAVVGSPDRAYLWVLARETALSAEEWEKAIAAASAQGFDTAALRRTDHGERPAS